MLAEGSVMVCEPKEKGECCRRTCGAPVEASDPAAWGRGRAGYWDECGLSLQESLVHWSWESCSGRSYHLEFRSTKHNGYR